LSPVLHERPIVDFLQQLEELVLLTIFFEAIGGVHIAIFVVVYLGRIEHEQFLGIVVVKLLNFLRKRHLVDDLVVYHLLIAR
jgi:hypothetical protein